MLSHFSSVAQSCPTLCDPINRSTPDLPSWSPPKPMSIKSVMPSLQSCPTLCDPMDCSSPGSSVHGILHKSTRVGCHSLLQGIFPTQRQNTGSPALQADSLPLSHQGRLKKAQRGKSTLQLKQKGWQTKKPSKVDVVSSLPQQEKKKEGKNGSNI